MARGDVVRKAESDGKQLFCKPCSNQKRFEERSHPTKGTGVKNNPKMTGAYSSYTRAKRRSKQGCEHHRAYRDVEFRFESFDEFFAHLGERPEGCSLDRINPLGHYEIGNVRWATHAEQIQNRLPRGYWQKKEGEEHGNVRQKDSKEGHEEDG